MATPTEVFNSVWTEIVAKGLKSPYLTTCEHNALHIASAFNVFAAQNNRPPTAVELARLILDLGRMGQKRPDGGDGILIYHIPQQNTQQVVREIVREVAQQAQTVQQADDATPPHSGDVSLAWLKSIDDYLDDTPAIREKIANFCQPAARGEMTRDASGKTLSERFSDRVTWLKNNNVRRPKVEKVVDANPLTEEQKRLNGVQSRLAALADRINRVVLDNPYSKKTFAFRASLHKKVDEMSKDRCTIGQVEAVIKAEIAQQESGSIR